MKNSDLSKFEPQCKMTRPGLGLTASPTEPQKVKFKEFLYTPNASEPIHLVNVDRDIQTIQPQEAELPLNEKQFFKDPLAEINEDKKDSALEEEQKPSEIKLGHHMRASVEYSSRKKQPTPLKIIESRRRLLDKMTEQREAYTRREMAQEDAKILINQLVSHGFQVSPPSDQLRFEIATPMTTASADFIPSGGNTEGEIMRSINNELERVQKFSQVPL